MKRFLVIAAIAMMAAFTGQNATAQGFKFAHINRDELIKAMPEYDSASVKLENTQKELVNQLEIMQVELNNKLDAYNKEMKNLTDLVKQTKEQELQDIKSRMDNFQANAQKQLQDQQAELFQPVVAKADKALKDVAKEGGYIYVFDTVNNVLYFDETKSVNIMPQVKAKLGLK